MFFPAKRRFATYTNLDAGTYTFLVKGSNRDGIWNEKGATLKIVITPPWWKTWWFQFLVAAGLIGIAIAIIMYRTRYIQNLNTILTETVTQKTKEMNEKNQVLMDRENRIQTQNSALIAQTKELGQQNVELEKARGLMAIELQYQHQRELLKLSIEVQEQERKRIAQDLHDELGAMLSITRMHLVQLHSKARETDIQKSSEEALALTETALAAIRRISYQLMPPQLEKYGLLKALDSVVKQINTANNIVVEITYQTTQTRFTMPIELGLYRIAMELIGNTLKHAQAQKIQLSLTQTNRKIILHYNDDGTGLPPNFVESNGFKNMKARINALSGNLQLGANGMAGFKAAIEIPIESNALT